MPVFRATFDFPPRYFIFTLESLQLENGKDTILFILQANIPFRLFFTVRLPRLISSRRDDDVFDMFEFVGFRGLYLARFHNWF